MEDLKLHGLIGGKKPKGDALPNNVLLGKTFSNDDDIELIGTMLNYESAIVTTDEISRSANKLRFSIPAAGYYGDSAQIQAVDNDWLESNIKAGVDIFGKVGSFAGIGFKASESYDILNSLQRFSSNKGTIYDTNDRYFLNPTSGLICKVVDYQRNHNTVGIHDLNSSGAILNTLLLTYSGMTLDYDSVVMMNRDFITVRCKIGTQLKYITFNWNGIALNICNTDGWGSHYVLSSDLLYLRASNGSNNHALINGLTGAFIATMPVNGCNIIPLDDRTFVMFDTIGSNIAVIVVNSSKTSITSQLYGGGSSGARQYIIPLVQGMLYQK